jgi:hypothetical protein
LSLFENIKGPIAKNDIIGSSYGYWPYELPIMSFLAIGPLIISNRPKNLKNLKI